MYLTALPESEPPPPYGAVVRDHRLRLGLTQEELAQAVAHALEAERQRRLAGYLACKATPETMSMAEIANIERGRTLPAVKTHRALRSLLAATGEGAVRLDHVYHHARAARRRAG